MPEYPGLEEMTLRDHFAAEAMNGMLAGANEYPHADIADAAYHAADAMLEVRGQKTELRKSHERLRAACKEACTLVATMYEMPPDNDYTEHVRNLLENALEDAVQV